MNKNLIAFIVIFTIFSILYFSDVFKKDRWIGFYYPDYNNLINYTHSPELKSLEECRLWVENQVSIYNSSGEGYDYECGKNCDYESGSDLYICEETVE